MSEMKGQFPFMMYHPTYPPETVDSQVELDAMISKGWRVTPVPPSEEETIKSKIKWHEDELKILNKELEAIEKDKNKIEVKKQKEKVEEAKVIVKEAEVKEDKVSNLTCSKCGRTFKNPGGRFFHERACKEQPKETK